MESASLELDVHTLRMRRNAKWQRYGPDVLPAWIAEMDLAIAGPIQDAMTALVDLQDYGYPRRGGQLAAMTVASAFADRMLDRFDWEIDPASVKVVTTLDQALAASILTATEPGDGIIVQTPCYPPFRDLIAETGRVLIEHPLIDDGSTFTLDLETLANVGGSKARAMILCNPHNPTGHVFSREELEAVASLARERDLIIISDEVHADLVYDGQTHRPIASLGDEVAARTLTLNSPSKSFNTPGLRCGVLHFGASALAERCRARIPPSLIGHPSSFGMDAAVAAWKHGQPWLDRTLAHLHVARATLVQAIEGFPGVRMNMPGATFLAWLDFTGLGLASSAHEFLLDQCRVAAMAGEMFAPECQHWVRFNFGTSEVILGDMLGRIHAGVTRS